MSETIKDESTAGADAVPVLDGVKIETPSSTVTDAPSGEGLKINRIMKIGAIALSGLFLVFLYQVFFSSGQQQQAPTKIAAKPVDATSFDKAGASQKSVDPELAKLDEKTKIEKAEAAAKKGESYMIVEPFGKDTQAGADLSGAKRATDGMSMTTTAIAPPPAPPTPMPPDDRQAGGNKQPTPQDIINAKLGAVLKTSSPSVSLGAPPAVRPIQNMAGTGMVMGPNGQMVSANGNIKPAIYEITAGTELFAQLTTGINSLVPETPVRAIILGGKYNGAIMLGKAAVKSNQYLVLNFNQMSLGKFTWPVEAVGTSVETGQAGLADEVNNKYFQRYGLAGGIGFVQALGAAVLQEGTNTQIISNGYGTTTTQSNPTLSNKQKVLIGLGGAGQATAPLFAEAQKDIKPEVMVYKDREIKIIFTKPFNPS